MPTVVSPDEMSEAPMGRATGDAEVEVDEEHEARTPKTKKPPVGMTEREWNLHKLTHLPYNPACRCCVAGRKRDDQHRRRSKGPLQTETEMDAENGAKICADYFFPRDAQERKG